MNKVPDLIERLRAHGFPDGSMKEKLLWESADEIERLRRAPGMAYKVSRGPSSQSDRDEVNRIEFAAPATVAVEFPPYQDGSPVIVEVTDADGKVHVLRAYGGNGGAYGVGWAYHGPAEKELLDD